MERERGGGGNGGGGGEREDHRRPPGSPPPPRGAADSGGRQRQARVRPGHQLAVVVQTAPDPGPALLLSLEHEEEVPSVLLF